VKRLPDRGEALLKRVTGPADVEVRMNAVAGLLALVDQGLNGFDAEMTIKEWKKGSLRDYWS
jgi:hypothetical protein